MSEIRANTISDAAGTGPVTLTKQSAAKAWANLNGTGTISLRDSENVSSLTDNGTGQYAVSLTNAFAAADYAVAASAANAARRGFANLGNAGLAAGSFPVFSVSAATSATIDIGIITASAHGNLA